ncbi:MAG: glycosyltransferase [Puniceicoccales bacterium]|jgi:glycosyltransferase involved in cell wall biosynthesis|nr:glycosyltransferase [Puniceicoccales bacterium]
MNLDTGAGKPRNAPAVNVWVVQVGEPVSFVDGGSRPFRSEMLANRLVERGHSVLRWASTFDPLRRVFRFQEAREISLGSSLRYRFLHGPTAYARSISPRYSRHGRELAAQFGLQASEEALPDLILCSLHPTPLALRVADHAHRHGVPLLLDVRDTWPDSLVKNLKFPWRPIAGWFFRDERRQIQKILHRADAITAISTECLRWSLGQVDRRSHGWDRIFSLAYEEPPREIFSCEEQRRRYLSTLKAADASHIVTCIGRVGSSFDFDLVVRLARHFWREGRRDVRFVLAGEEPVRRILQKKFSSLPNLTVTGWLDQRELYQLLAVTTVGLLPYKDMHRPTIRNKPLDFLSMGVPMLSSLHGELFFLMRQNSFGICFPPKDLDALHALLCRLLQSPNLRESMRENGLRVFRENFLADKVYGEFAAHLEAFHRHRGRVEVAR